MQIQKLPIIRGRDRHGAGYYGASRGKRKHNGIDCLSNANSVEIHAEGSIVRAMNFGMVTKLGYPYANDLSYRYVEVQDAKGYRCRYFYTDPTVEVGDSIEIGEMLGTVQVVKDSQGEPIVPHVHFEVVTGSRPKAYHDPVKYLCGDLR